MDVFDFFTEDELDDAPEDPALAFAHLVRIARAKLRDRTREYYADMRAHIADMARRKREQAIRLRVTAYEWLAMDVHGCCEVAAKNGGEQFTYADPPPEGHPGEGQCTSPDWCRCVAMPVIDGSLFGTGG